MAHGESTAKKKCPKYEELTRSELARKRVFATIAQQLMTAGQLSETATPERQKAVAKAAILRVGNGGKGLCHRGVCKDIDLSVSDWLRRLMDEVQLVRDAALRHPRIQPLVEGEDHWSLRSCAKRSAARKLNDAAATK